MYYSGGKRGWVGDNPFIFLDTSKIRSTGWKPNFSIEKSVVDTVEYIIKNKWILKKKLNITVFGPTSKIGLELTKKYLDDGNILNLFYRNRKAKISLKKKFIYKKKINQVRLIKYNFSNLKTLKLNLKKNKDIINKTEIIIITTAEQGEIKNFLNRV